MLKKQGWLVLKILELLLTLSICWLLAWFCCQNNNHLHVLLLAGFYGVASITSLGFLIAFFLLKEPIMRYEAEHAFILSILHLISIYIHLNTAIMKMCTVSVLVALGVTALYLLHCNIALNQMFYDERYTNQPFIMPPFYFKRSGGPQVYICEPLPSLNGPTGLPPVYYEEI